MPIRMKLFDRSFWPERERRPYMRLALALVLSPFLWALLGSLFGFAVASLTEDTMEGVLDYTLDLTLVAFGALFVFTFTLGIIGVLMLWAGKLRGATPWALMGGMMGAVVFAINALVYQTRLDQVLLIIYVILGWSLFLTIRWIAGVRELRGSETKISST